MKNKFALWGLLGLLGIMGIIISSVPLSSLVLLFLLFSRAPVPPGAAFDAMVGRAGKRAFVSFAAVSGSFYLLAAILARTPLMRLASFQIELMLLVSVLMGGYMIGIAVFAGSILAGSLILKKE
ncbi:MAG: hypothetical protein LBT39_05690 [Treponema sp.]|jgi:hypothetical protein|nr:hypothetical protein [Treponema sp.]